MFVPFQNGLISQWKSKQNGCSDQRAKFSCSCSAQEQLRNALSAASETGTSYGFPGIKTNYSKPNGPNLNYNAQQRQETTMGNECVLGRFGGGKTGLQRREQKAAEAAGDQGESWTCERQRNAEKGGKM